MAKRSQPPAPTSAKLTPDQLRRGIARLTKRLEEVTAFDPEKVSRDDPSALTRPLSAAIETSLAETFGVETIEYDRYHRASYFNYSINMLSPVPLGTIIRDLARERQKSIDLLTSALDLLRERLEEAGETAVTEAAPVKQLDPKKVFIVHGHDEAVRETVARFVERIGLDPVILHERPNRGRTIIAKFREESADVGFAIVLITPDDEGNRPRPNVLLELGFFLGALGPDRVAPIVKQPVETPSDYDGVVYIPYDGGGWKIALARELEAAGYRIDWNTVMKGG